MTILDWILVIICTGGIVTLGVRYLAAGCAREEEDY